jgi:phage tail protein X
MSNEAHKADQIAYRYYTKLVSTVHSARATAEPNPLAKVDKWVRHCLFVNRLTLTMTSSVQSRDP